MVNYAAMDSGGDVQAVPSISILGAVRNALNTQLVNISTQIQQQPWVPQPQRQQLQQATYQLQQQLPPPPPPPPPPLPPLRSINDYQDPYFKNSANDPFAAFQLSPLANQNEDVLTGFELYTDEDRKRSTELFGNMSPEQQEIAAQKSRENREYVERKNRIISEVENVQAKDPNLPAVEREALQALKVQISLMKVKDVNNDLNPMIVTLRNLGTRAQYRIEQAEWKKNKTAGNSLNLPMGLPTTSEEFDDMGGLGGFLTTPTSKTAGDFDRTPAIFGKLITRDANGVETIISANDWIAARIADTKPLPNDSAEERRRKEKLAADWIATLAFTDKYNSFAQKRDAGYRVQLDSNGNPVRAYFLKPDEDALKNLAAEILTDMATHNIVGPIEDWIQAYAEQRQNLAANATGIFGNGQPSNSGSGYGYSSRGGYYGGGGYGGGGGGGQITTYYPTEAEVIEPAEGVMRARLGRGLTDDEKADFVAFFRGIESSVLAAGGAIGRLDPQAQAIAWLESKLDEEYKREQSGRYIVALMNMFRSGNWNVS